MKKGRLFLFMTLSFIITSQLVLSQPVSQSSSKPVGIYIDFIRNQTRNPVDYVLYLFDHADIVILCERAHSEITQYQLILKIIKENKFIDQAGHVFLEIGNYQLQPYVEEFLMNDRLSENEVKEHLFHILRNCSNSPIWDYTNYFDFMKSVYEINKKLPVPKKIHVYPSNLPFSWEGMTIEKYGELRKNRGRIRDKIIADQIKEKYNSILNSGIPRKKALVIMNYRHAFPHLDVKIKSKSRFIDNVGGYLMDAFPGKTVNVMLNSIRTLAATDTSMSWTALQDGKWDAAFALTGNPEIGFDFEDSPFGSDAFDYFPFQHDYTYNDIFTGFVFFKPLEKHVMQYGIPGIFDESFKKEYAERYRIMDDKIDQKEIDKMITELGMINEYNYDTEDRMGASDYKEVIQKWLRN